MNGEFLVIDLCCGMGGLSLAAHNAGMTPIIGVDIDLSAIRTYKNNFEDAVTINGDITELQIIKEVRKHLDMVKNDNDLVVIVSGPPCQGFSMAGPRNASDPRNRVLLAVANAISDIQPDMALIENVSFVTSSKNKIWISNLKKAISEANYNLYQVELNAKDYGLAQSRCRVFFFVTKKTFDLMVVKDYLEELKVAPVTVEDVLMDLPDAPVRPDKYIDNEDNGRLPNHFSMKHSKKVQMKIAKIEPGKGPLSYRKLNPNGVAGTLISGHRAPPAHYLYPRSISVREAARLQGFPDDYKVYGRFGRQMNQVTNAVPPPLGFVALKTILEFAW